MNSIGNDFKHVNPSQGRKSSGRKFYKLVFLISGFFATLWFLIRVIPKPSRATYPCIKATMPVAYAFVAYVVSITGSLFFFRKAWRNIRQRQFRLAILALAAGGLFGTWMIISNEQKAMAVIAPTSLFTDPLGPNAPIGEAQGIHPGRVVWVWDPEATNEDLVGHEDYYWDDAYTDMAVVDQMFSDGILALTGEETDSAAWEAIFRHFNQHHDKGEVGYHGDETIFIKINAVTAWGGAWPSGNMSSSRAIEYDTSPQAILAMLRQLVNEAGIPQEKIFIGDPLCDIYNHIYDYLVIEFPDVNYGTQYGIPNRYDLTKGTEVLIHYSDGGDVMPEGTNNNKLFLEMSQADYILNIPTMKGHRWAGTTFFAKNHFGSNTYSGSRYLHPGLINNDNKEMRTDYGMYRVLVDLMGSQYLGRKTLLFCMEGLWSTSYEHQPAQKFRTSPFNGDYCSSLFFSMDPVAIESVALDILQKEFQEEEIVDGMDAPKADRWTFVHFGAVDDYLHQAADSDWWPEGITYDPDDSGTPIPSLGVHEHWNNETDMQYSRDLGTGEGIELVKIFKAVPDKLNSEQAGSCLSVYPNPFTDLVNIILPDEANAATSIRIFAEDGRLIATEQLPVRTGQKHISLNLGHLESGSYIVLIGAGKSGSGIIASQRILKP